MKGGWVLRPGPPHAGIQPVLGGLNGSYLKFRTRFAKLAEGLDSYCDKD
jgi:hypothetical protein